LASKYALEASLPVFSSYCAVVCIEEQVKWVDSLLMKGEKRRALRYVYLITKRSVQGIRLELIWSKVWTSCADQM